MPKKIFVNLMVKDLAKTMEFWTKLGFTFNKQFTNENAASLVISDDIYAMLLTEPFFKRFTNKEIIDAHKSVECLTAISFDSKEEVDALFEKVIAAGGTKARDTEDLGYMYNRPFQDLDGHIWEPFWMDPAQIQA